MVLVGLSTATWAQSPNSAAKRALAKDVPSVNLINVSFAEAIDHLREISNANINVQWKTLELVHITKDTPVNLKLRQVPMRKALQIVLAEAGPEVPLTYYVDQGVIEITTRDAADSKMITKVYDVSDLIADIPDFGAPVNFNLSSKGGGGSGGSGSSSGGSGGGGLFNPTGNTAEKEKGSTATERGEKLLTTITSTIRPEIWQANGGTATIAFFRGRLIVTAPRSVQEMIGGPVD